MYLTVVGPVGYEENIPIMGEENCTVATQGANLATLLQEYTQSVEACFINNNPELNWQTYIPQKRDRVKIHMRTSLPAVIAIPIATAISSATAGAISVATAVTLVNTVVSSVVSMALSMIVRALTPGPKSAKLNGNVGSAYGITGFQNTTGQGTPIPVYWGIQRVAPHIVAGGIDISEDNQSMTARVLYCVGDSGGDQYGGLSNVEIDDVPVEQYEGVQVHYRLGAMDQAVIPEFENVSTPWFDGRTLDWRDDTQNGLDVEYTTKSSTVNRSTATIAFPNGLYRLNSLGKNRHEYVSIDIWYKDANPAVTDWTRVSAIGTPYDSGQGDMNFHFENDKQSAVYYKVVIEHGAGAINNQWILKFHVNGSHPFPIEENHVATAQLYNVEETTFTTRNYGGYVLLGLTGIPARQVKSLQSMHVSVLVDGKRVKVPDGSGGFTLRSGQERCWIVRDMMVGPCGMDYEFDEAEIDDQQWLNDSQAYYYNLVPGHEMVSGLVVGGSTTTRVQLDQSVLLTFENNPNNLYFITITYQGTGHKEIRAIGNVLGISYTYIDIATTVSIYQGALPTVPSAGDGFSIAPAEQLDQCNVPCTDRRWDWDWVRAVAGEGRATVFPSGLKWKYVIDQPGLPNLLFIEPGNIIENSIKIEVGPPEDDPYTQILAEYRDQDDVYRPALTPPIDGPDAPYPSIIQKAIHFDTITRESEAVREVMIVIKHQFLERRRWLFASPIGKLVSEPRDLDYMAERQVGGIGAYTGTLPAGSTSTTIVLKEPVVLEENTTYLLKVQRRDNTPAESRTVTQAAGTWIAVTIDSPFSVDPVEGDWFALGKLDVDYIVTRCQDVKIDNSGRVSQIRTEYVPEIYNPDPIPPKVIRRHWPYISTPPIPLRDASVSNQNVQRIDGSWASVILYDVTPGLISVPTRNTGVAWPNVYLDADVLPSSWTPYQWHYFLGATWKLVSGAAAGSTRKVLGYDPNGHFVYLEGGPPNGPITDEYSVLYWEKYSDTYGFKIEISTDGGGIYSEVAKVTGFHYERDGGDQGGTFYYRFTALNASGVENRTARVVKYVTLAGDSVAPPAPTSVMAFATTSFITVEATFQLPMALDFAGIEILVRQFFYGAFGQKTYAGSPVVQTRTDATRENGTSGTVAIRKTVDIRNIFNYPPAPQLWDVAVRAYDYSGNKSAWVQGNDFYPQKLTSNDIA